MAARLVSRSGGPGARVTPQTTKLNSTETAMTMASQRRAIAAGRARDGVRAPRQWGRRLRRASAEVVWSRRVGGCRFGCEQHPQQPAEQWARAPAEPRRPLAPEAATTPEQWGRR